MIDRGRGALSERRAGEIEVPSGHVRGIRVGEPLMAAPLAAQRPREPRAGEFRSEIADGRGHAVVGVVEVPEL